MLANRALTDSQSCVALKFDASYGGGPLIRVSFIDWWRTGDCLTVGGAANCQQLGPSAKCAEFGWASESEGRLES